ncbi:hypothetical protein GCM10017667_23190 [Streptomyces filamentosus]|uniref:Uncharacterized protein n=1 Tax=Streptomyces filamentosus TaxID=67294 RepID=A0A919BK31_STRFL|nr:hypothetical protein GCM10017667_23190 [Streptomyces filamentosus]
MDEQAEEEAEEDEGAGGQADLAVHGPDGLGGGAGRAVQGVARGGPAAGAAGEVEGGDAVGGEAVAGAGGAVAGLADQEEFAAGGGGLQGGDGAGERVEGDVVGAGDVAGGVLGGVRTSTTARSGRRSRASAASRTGGVLMADVILGCRRPPVPGE